MSDDAPTKPRRGVPPPMTALEKLTYPEGGAFRNYSFRTGIYDYPDGEECVSKLLKSVRLATVASSFASLIDLTVYNPPATPAVLVTSYLSFVLPAASAAAVFTSTNCIVANIRGKDDWINHFVGGGLGGAVLVARFGRIGKALTAAALGAVIAAGTRVSIEESTDHTTHVAYRSTGGIGHEFTYIGGRSSTPGAWTSESKEPTDY